MSPRWILIALATTCLATQAATPVGEPHVYKKVEGKELKLYVTKPADWKAGDHRPAIVFYHGGGWTGGAPGQFTEHSKYFASRGLVCVQVQYRLLDKKQSAPPITCIQDAKSGFRWVMSHAKELGIDPGRVATGGGSAGGHLASFIGLMDGIDDPNDDLSVPARSKAMLLFNPVFDNGPTGWGYKRTGEDYLLYSPFHHVNAGDPPAIVFLGDRDNLIPVKTLEAFQKSMDKAGVLCESHVYEGQGHGFFNHGKADNKYYLETVRAADRFLVRMGWLKGEPTL